MIYTALRSAVAGLALLAALGAPLAASPDEVQEISRLMRAGQFDLALQRADAHLATRPRNAAQTRFLKGLILTEQNKTAEAIVIFQRLSEDFPELPEPYNNLAVLHASLGQYDRARASLEMAIRTHPSYATAHENLGDVYAKLASQAYDKALQLDSGNAGAQTKLSLIRDLVSGGQRAPGAAPVRPPAPAVTPVPAAPVAPATPSRAPEPAKPAAVATPPLMAQAPAARPAEAARAAPAAAPAAPAAPAVPPANAEVAAAIQGWAKAWSTQDMDGYLAAYDKGFVPARGLSRDAWEKERRARIVGRAKISVVVEDLKVDWDGTLAKVKFRQHYKSDQLTTSSTKHLTLTKTNGKWLIKQERTG